MSEMVERVATAIGCINDNCRNSQECKDCSTCLRAARAAIEAMREPTSEMCMDGADSGDDLSHFGAQNVWVSMIDAALK